MKYVKYSFGLVEDTLWVDHIRVYCLHQSFSYSFFDQIHFVLQAKQSTACDFNMNANKMVLSKWRVCQGCCLI